MKADASNTGCSVTGGDCAGLHFVDPDLGRYMHITTRGDNLDEGTPMRFMSASLKMDQGWSQNLMKAYFSVIVILSNQLIKSNRVLRLNYLAR